jgi:peroxiredoxin
MFAGVWPERRLRPYSLAMNSPRAFSTALTILFLSACATPAHETAPQSAAALAPAAGARGASTEPSRPAKNAPDFVSKDAAGKEVKLSDFKDKIVILDFWATWCGPCMQSLPHTQELAAKYKDAGVVVLAVCTGDTREKFDAWVKKNQTKYPGIVFTCELNDRGSDKFDERASSKLYQVPGLPTQFVIGRDQKIAAQLVGYDDAGDARAESALGHLGVNVDAALVAKGEAQIKQDADEAAAEAAEEAANPPPVFVPQLGQLKSGDMMPAVSLTGPDGQEFTLASLRGKTLVLGIGFEDIVPTETLRTIGAKHGANGVVPLAVMLYSKREAYDAWLAQQQGKPALASGWDPAAAFAGDRENPDMKAMAEWDSKTFLRKVLGGAPLGGTPAFPFFFVVDPAGKFVGMFWAGKMQAEGLGNLLLRAGVELAAADMPMKIASPSDFVVQPPPPPEAPVAQLAIGAVAPDFAMTDANGRKVKLSDYKGKVVVLDFWATWCGPCVASMPHTQEVAAHYKDQGVVVIGSCTSDARAAFETWVRKNQSKYADFVFAHDAAEKGPERASRKLYGVRGIPAQFVIGRDGKVAAFVGGYKSGEVLLEGALAKAGIKVDPAIVAQAALDQKKREEQ